MYKYWTVVATDFSEEDARQALQKHENKLQEAINWLLSDRP